VPEARQGLQQVLPIPAEIAVDNETQRFLLFSGLAGVGRIIIIRLSVLFVPEDVFFPEISA